ncbi:MAG: glycosyltransferase family 2 protein [Eubacteriales bacterium]|nr:glycosyltransferase family 2 protein [Eubacteriales bacterium]
MKPIDFSLVIPVYNTPEPYLAKCLESILTNQASSYEILLVDDGSGEQTAGFLKKMEQTHACIRVLRQENKGVSAARNYGLTEARGEFVSFADSDDLLVPGILDKLLPILETYRPDLLITQISREVRHSMEQPELEIGGESLKQDLREYYLTMNHPGWKRKDAWINRAPHGRFVKRELALKTPFREGIFFGEDVLWNFDLLTEARKILLYLGQGYCYQEVDFSATQSYRPDFPAEVRTLLLLYQKEMRHWPEELKPHYWTAALEYFTILMRVYVFAGEGKPKEKFAKEMRTGYWQDVFRNVQPAGLPRRYQWTALLGKYRLYGAIYGTFAAYHDRRKKWKNMQSSS